MSRTHRMLSDSDFAKFVAGLGHESFEVVYPAYNPGDIYVRCPTVSVGGIHASLGANDIKAIIEERDELRRCLEEAQDSRRAKVWVKGGEVIVGTNDVVEIRGAKKVVLQGPVRVVEVI